MNIADVDASRAGRDDQPVTTFAAPGLSVEDHRQARISEQRAALAGETGWPMHRVRWLTERAELLGDGDPLQVRKVIAGLRRECRDDLGEMARKLLQRTTSHADQMHRGLGEHLAITLPVGTVARIRADAGYLPEHERITHYDGLDAALILWRHNRGPQHRDKTVGRIVGVDRGRIDPTVFVKISDNCPDILTMSRFGELGCSIGYVATHSTRTVGPQFILDDVEAAVGEISLCLKSEASYDCRLRHATPTAELQQQHRRAMQPSSTLGPLHLRGKATRCA